MTDPDLKAHVISALRMVPQIRRQALSDGSIHRIVTNEGHEASKLDIQQARAELVEEGRLRIVGEKGRSKRYEFVDETSRNRGSDRPDELERRIGNSGRSF